MTKYSIIRLFTRSSCFIGLVCILISNQVIAADKGGYFSGHLGFTSLDDSNWSYTGLPDDVMSYNTGYTISGAGGYDFGMFRLEGELSYNYNEVDQYVENSTFNSTFSATDGAIDSTSLMVNAYFDIENNSPVTPYLMGGIGFSYIELYDVVANDGFTTITFYDQNDTVFAYQLGGGLEFAFNDTLSLDVAYRYIATADLDFNGINVEYGGNRFMVGLRATF